MDRRRHHVDRAPVARLALMAGGAAMALAGSCMAWTSGTIIGGGNITRSGLDDNGKLTALLALATVCCSVWCVRSPHRRSVIAALVSAGLLFTVALAEWNMVSDRVNRAGWSDGRWSSLTVGPGIYLLLFGSAFALAGAIWSARSDRR